MSPDKEVDEELFKRALETRNLELKLTWKRSLFFWGFLTTGMAAYGFSFQLSGLEERMFRLISSMFTLGSSLAWALSNMAGKFWHEYWENVIKTSKHRHAKYFKHEPDAPLPVEDPTSRFAKRSSLSKSLIIFSWCVFFLWLLIASYEAYVTITSWILRYML